MLIPHDSARSSVPFVVLSLLAAIIAVPATLQSAHALEPVRAVGTFGGFVRGDKPDIPPSNGFLTFSADNQLQAHRLLWKNLLPGGKDFALDEVRFTGAPADAQPHFVDWSTLAPSTRSGPKITAYLSRTFPAVRYESATRGFKLETGIDGRAPMTRMAAVLNGQIKIFDLRATPSPSLATMSEPWIVLWSGGARGWDFDVPLLLTLTQRPRRVSSDASGLNFAFDGEMGALNLMPLKGLKRYAPAETLAWSAQLPADVIIESRAWASMLAAFPASMTETFTVNEQAGTVAIQDHYTYRETPDIWETQPTRVAPLPPVVVRAGNHGFPVQYPAEQPNETGVATYYGPFFYAHGDTSSYTLPLPHALTRLPIPMRVENSVTATAIRAELERIVGESLPTEPSDYYLQNDNLAAALYCDAFPTFAPDSALRARAQTAVPLLLDNSFSDEAIPASIEPVTSQSYLSVFKHSFGAESFDREWYIGRQLAAISRCGETLDLDIARRLWPKVLGLYNYDRIFFDWVTGSVTSSVFGFNELADGMNFAWDGMMGVARLAKLLGDTATYQDAAYRSARQQLAIYGAWFQARWSRQIDYGIAHFSVQKLPADQIETFGAIDGWVEDFGSATLEPSSFWQTANYLYYDIPAQYSFYRDFGLEDRVWALEYEIMPTRHPHWTDGNALEPIDGRYYGSDNAAAHLLARAVLFHDDPASLFAIYQGYQGTESSKQWYTISFYGAAGPLMLELERARAPVVEIPVDQVQLQDASFDVATRTVKLQLLGRRDGSGTIRVREPGGQWSEVSASWKQGGVSVVTIAP